MTLTVRLPDEVETSLDRFCAATGKTRSWVVNESLAAYLVSHAPSPRALLQQHLPSLGSGRGDLAENHAHILKDKLRSKHR
ncbi:MAG: ribbon-helix-helix domain-containing protein [Thiobacillus sp.]